MEFAPTQVLSSAAEEHVRTAFLFAWCALRKRYPTEDPRDPLLVDIAAQFTPVLQHQMRTVLGHDPNSLSIVLEWLDMHVKRTLDLVGTRDFAAFKYQLDLRHYGTLQDLVENLARHVNLREEDLQGLEDGWRVTSCRQSGVPFVLVQRVFNRSGIFVPPSDNKENEFECANLQH